MRGLIAAANQDPRLTRVFSTFTATNPSLCLDIDRDKAQALGLSISDVFTTLSATLGGIYVNNFNLYGRTWQVNIEGEALDRGDIPAIWRIFVRNRRGEMVPLRSIASRAHRDRAAGDHPLQQLPLDHHRRRPGARRVVRHCAGGDGADVGDGRCRRATGSNGPARRIRRNWRPGRPARSWRWRCCSPICSWSACTKAGRSRCRCCFRWSVGVLGAFVGIRIAGLVAGSVCADRPGGADRAGGEERHPDRRVRQGTARGRACRSARRRCWARACGSAR